MKLESAFPILYLEFSKIRTAIVKNLLLASVIGLGVLVPHTTAAQPPRLAVVIVLDQFPYDYIARFQPYFGPDGFNYLIKHGADFTNARYAYSTTKTAAGHAVISTGAYGHRNGIIANSWYSRERQKMVGAVDDDSVQIIGRSSPGHSPKFLQTYTAGDMLRLGSRFRSKVISVAIKDRAAILLGGKLGQAYWVEDSLFVTSTYYRKALPQWVDAFNASGAMKRFFGKAWQELRPDIAVRICDPETASYKTAVNGIGTSFPHILYGTDTAHVTGSYYQALAYTPFATEALLSFARELCRAESLGTRGATDMLCIGISTTDAIGHPFGPQSREVFDNALRTDRMLADFIKFLDRQVGLSKCLLVLTSDHGIAPIPEYLTRAGSAVPAGRVASSAISTMVSTLLNGRFGALPGNLKWIDGVAESDVYLNRDALAAKHIPLDSATALIRDSLGQKDPFASAFTRQELQSDAMTDELVQRCSRSFFPSRSGDVYFVLKPFYIMSGGKTGTNHGQPYDYDSHVPVLLAGPGVVPGVYRGEVSPADIAPTISTLLQIEFPPSREGKVLKEALR